MDCCVKIGILRKNLRSFDNKVALMVKANAYGHGIALVKKTQDLVEAYGVATEEEAIRLRRFTDKPILVTAPNVRFAKIIDTLALTPMVSDPMQLVAINECATKPIKVHLKIDSGMGRFGTKTLAETKTMLRVADKLPNVQISGICTHFSSLAAATEQIRVFDKHIQVAETRVGRLLRHASASGTVCVDKYDMQRIGFSAYANIMTVKSTVASVKTLKKGESAGYGNIFTATKKTKIAVIYGGYADGIPKNAVGFQVKIRDKMHKIVAVCMDVFIVELLVAVEVGDTVTVIQSQKSLDKLAVITNKIPYELYVGFVGRCKFVYEE